MSSDSKIIDMETIGLRNEPRMNDIDEYGG